MIYVYLADKGWYSLVDGETIEGMGTVESIANFLNSNNSKDFYEVTVYNNNEQFEEFKKVYLVHKSCIQIVNTYKMTT